MFEVQEKQTLTTDSEPFLKKNGSMTVQEERDSLRLQMSNLSVAFKEVSEKLSMYKNRCAGVDTIAHMLKESKLEVVRLTKQCKVWETVVANLQNRLSTHGLSSSVNIEETELFVPGASKQTLDNLARENARLRSQLKNSENQAAKKLTDDIQALKSSLETLEGENNQLKAELLQVEDAKTKMIQQYEMELSEQRTGKEINKDTKEVKTDSIMTQTDECDQSDVDALRTLLSQVSQSCLKLEDRLDKSQNAQIDNTCEQDSSTSTSELQEMREKYNDVLEMNQRWQRYSEEKEQEVHVLHARISGLDELKQEVTMLKSHLERKEQRNAQLKQELERQTRQPVYDNSIVEILKQQIQVCTEDFNTERKDREKAVNRAKQQQEDIFKLSEENGSLKSENEALKKRIIMMQSQSYSQQVQVPYSAYRQDLNQLSQHNQYQMRGYHAPGVGNRLPYRGSVSSGASSISSSPSSSYTPSNITPRSHSEDNVPAYGEVALPTGNTQARGFEAEFLSLPKTVGGAASEHLPSVSQFQARPALTSMPPPRRNEDYNQISGDFMTCPQCGEEFNDQDLLTHMNVCSEAKLDPLNDD